MYSHFLLHSQILGKKTRKIHSDFQADKLVSRQMTVKDGWKVFIHDILFIHLVFESKTQTVLKMYDYYSK